MVTLREVLPDMTLPEPHEWLVAGRVDSPFELRRVEIDPPLGGAPAEGQRITLKLQYHDERSGQATMVWSGTRWHVALPQALEVPAIGLGTRAPAQAEAPEADAVEAEAVEDGEESPKTPGARSDDE
ncbi:MAG: hypothetical protein H0U74_14365 [Bradymonadaceae bacterium]|nr:hypothetical protein [Lujinxingiaceae bacterium]